MKAKIVIASTLKPVIDPRAYEKIGNSLALGGYEVHLIGALPTTTDDNKSVTLRPLKKSDNVFSRLSLPWKALVSIMKIRPKVLIITTHELLFIGVLYKFFFAARLIYDVQENYSFNLIYQNNYPFSIRHLMAYYVRLKEILLAVFVDHFLLAEQCYVDELKFIGDRYTVIENKYLPAEKVPGKIGQLQTELLLAGTIGTAYGVFEALHFFKQLPASEFRLIMIGHCAHKQTLQKLKKEVAGIENIDFLVSDSPVPHQDILSQIGDKTIGLLPYQMNKSTANKMPTKLYEYIGMGVPVLVSHNPVWDKLIKNHAAAISIDFLSPPNLDDIRQSLTLNKSYQQSDLKNIMWNSEENKLLALINRYFNRK